MSYKPSSTTGAAKKVPLGITGDILDPTWLATGTPADLKAPVGSPPVWSSIVNSVNGQTGAVTITGGTGAIVNYSVSTDDVQLVDGYGAALNCTSKALVAKAPLSPTINQTVGIRRYAGAAKNRSYLMAEGTVLNGVNGLISVATLYDDITVRYIDSTVGWLLEDAADINLTLPIPGIQFLMLPNATWTQSGGTISNIKDHSGNAYDAVQASTTNQPTYASTGINSGPSADFDGVDNYMSISASLLGSDGPFWAVVTFIPDTVSTANQELMCKFDNAHQCFALRINSSQVDARVIDQTNGGVRGKTSSTLSNGTKYTALMEYSAGTVTLTLNNVDQPTLTSTGSFVSLTDTTAPVRLGARHTTPTGFYDGDVSFAAVGTGTLTAAQRSAIYTFANSL